MMRIPVNTLRFWRHSGVGPISAKIGARVMYQRDDVEAWLRRFDETGNEATR